jgi:hypothetical protein
MLSAPFSGARRGGASGAANGIGEGGQPERDSGVTGQGEGITTDLQARQSAGDHHLHIQ